MKILMAFTGLIGIIFVLAHMWGNLKMFFGPEAFNHYAEWLKHDLMYPLLPHGWFIWIFRICMLAVLVGHMGAAFHMIVRNKRARGSKYKVKSGTKKHQSWPSKTMKVGGITILLFLVFHLLQFTALKIEVGGDYQALTPYHRVIASFTPDNAFSIFALVFYTAAIVFLSFHVWHGTYSACTTLGMARTGWQKFFRVLGALFALVLLVGFLLPPMAIATGFIS